MHFEKSCILVTAGIGIAVVGYCYYRKRQSIKQAGLLKETPSGNLPAYATVGEVKHIFLYGIDGGHPFEVVKAFCAKPGLQHKKNRTYPSINDRNYVVYTEDKHICYTTNIKLATIRLTMGDDLRLEAINDGKKIRIENKEINKEKTVRVEYSIHTLNVYDCGDRVARFLSEHLLEKNSGLRLGQFVVPPTRKCLNPCDEITNNPDFEQLYLIESMKPEYNSFSLISEETIDYIHGLRGCEHITPKHLRAHIVIELTNGNGNYNDNSKAVWQRPFIEDQFEEIEIGSASFTNVALRAINKSVNVDPETGIFSKNRQPYRILKRFRKAHLVDKEMYKKVCIPVVGINMGIQFSGVIRVGDQVHVKFKEGLQDEKLS